MLVSRYSPDILGFESLRGGGAEIFSLHICPERPWVPPSLLYNGYLGYLPVVKRPELPLTALSHLSTRYGMDRVISLLSLCNFQSISAHLLY